MWSVKKISEFLGLSEKTVKRAIRQVFPEKHGGKGGRGKSLELSDEEFANLLVHLRHKGILKLGQNDQVSGEKLGQNVQVCEEKLGQNDQVFYLTPRKDNSIVEFRKSLAITQRITENLARIVEKQYETMELVNTMVLKLEDALERVAMGRKFYPPTYQSQAAMRLRQEIWRLVEDYIKANNLYEKKRDVFVDLVRRYEKETNRNIRQGSNDYETVMKRLFIEHQAEAFIEWLRKRI